MKPHQIISLMTFEGTDNTFAMGDHDDHIHVGFRPLYGAELEGRAKQVDAILKPKQWIKLIDRLGEIDNPDGARAALEVLAQGHPPRVGRAHGRVAPGSPSRGAGYAGGVRPPFIDHITVKVRDLEAGRAFYEAALARFGVRVVDYGEIGIGIGPEGSEDLGLSEGEPRAPVHIAFLAQDPATVDAFHAAALEAGGTDNGAPGRAPELPRALLRGLRARPGRQQRGSRLPHGALRRRVRGAGGIARADVNGSGWGRWGGAPTSHGGTSGRAK